MLLELDVTSDTADLRSEEAEHIPFGLTYYLYLLKSALLLQRKKPPLQIRRDVATSDVGEGEYWLIQ